jgi:hypothetical protein
VTSGERVSSTQSGPLADNGRSPFMRLRLRLRWRGPPAGTGQEPWASLYFGLRAIVSPREYERLSGCRFQALSWRARLASRFRAA